MEPLGETETHAVGCELCGPCFPRNLSTDCEVAFGFQALSCLLILNLPVPGTGSSPHRPRQQRGQVKNPFRDKLSPVSVSRTGPVRPLRKRRKHVHLTRLPAGSWFPSTISPFPSPLTPALGPSPALRSCELPGFRASVEGVLCSVGLSLCPTCLT